MMTKSTSEGAPGKAPQRTCIVCRKTKNKRELVRLVRTAENRVEIDTGGKKPGRGAYLCREPECWNELTRGTRLEHTLRVKIPRPEIEKLADEGQALFKDAAKE